MSADLETVKKVRALMELCQQQGLDAVAALDRAKLLWTREALVQARVDTMGAVAALLQDIPATHIPHDATMSAGAMKAFLIEYIRELARRQQ